MQNLIAKVKNKQTRFVVVTGGVCSSIGKGVLVASLGVLLKNAGYKLSVLKWDPYLNVDPGTMSPLVHGEVFVTADGAETDLDLGHYERYLQLTLTKASSVSSGQIYREVLDGERSGKFLGKCIQLVPHVVDVVKDRLLNFALQADVDFVLLEIGGTVGDIEGEVFLEAIRQLRRELDDYQLFHAHLSYVPVLSWTGEIKTKPTQHSVLALKRTGLTPHALFLRADQAIEPSAVAKLAVMCDVPVDHIFQVLTYDAVYKIFVELNNQGVTERLQQHAGIAVPRHSNLDQWQQYLGLIRASTEPIKIAFVAKYVGSNDPYISVIDALKAAAFHNRRRLQLIEIEAEQLELDVYAGTNAAWQLLKSADAIVVPGGFDKRGVDGKILAARYARENLVPYLGLCLGMQVMVIEAARHMLGLADANSTEFDPATKYPVIDFMEEQRTIKHKGGSMRLGSYPCSIKPGSLAHSVYGKTMVTERHRHRFEVNNSYRTQLENQGAIVHPLSRTIFDQS